MPRPLHATAFWQDGAEMLAHTEEAYAHLLAKRWTGQPVVGLAHASVLAARDSAVVAIARMVSDAGAST